MYTANECSLIITSHTLKHPLLNTYTDRAIKSELSAQGF